MDYNFKKIDPQYLIGMSVPPVMTAQIATEIYNQWFK
jgi:DNA (cytosine-5)-methyltransferase 1